MGNIREGYNAYINVERKVVGCLTSTTFLALLALGVLSYGVSVSDHDTTPGRAVPTSDSVPNNSDPGQGQIITEQKPASEQPSDQKKIGPGSIFAELPGGNSSPDEQNSQESHNSGPERYTFTIENCQGYPVKVECWYGCELERSIPPKEKGNIFNPPWVNRRTKSPQEAEDMCAEPAQ